MCTYKFILVPIFLSFDFYIWTSYISLYHTYSCLCKHYWIIFPKYRYSWHVLSINYTIYQPNQKHTNIMYTYLYICMYIFPYVYMCIYIYICAYASSKSLYWNTCIITFAVYTLHMHMPYGYRHVDHGVFVVISQWIHDKFNSWILTCQLDIVWRQVWIRSSSLDL